MEDVCALLLWFVGEMAAVVAGYDIVVSLKVLRTRLR